MAMQEAEAECIRTGGGHLASIHSDAQRDAIAALGVDVWIGFHDRHSEAGCGGQGHHLDADEMTFIWTDGSPSDYMDWADGEPNDWGSVDADCGNGDDETDCTHMQSPRCHHHLQR
eukprot:COSAG06_NODE_7199_length_2587_cov_1.336817_2_plen_116_part_00